VDPGPETTLPEPPPKKRRRVNTKATRAFKKEFDPPPSTLLDRLPSSQKSTPFKSMVSDWWLESHPEAKTLPGAAWLMGFHKCLKEEDLHLVDREYLRELMVLHKEKGILE